MKQNWAVVVLLTLLAIGLVVNYGSFAWQLLPSPTRPTPTASPNPKPMPPDAIEPYVPPESGENPGVACTMEAKLCPDGSSVGRVPPNCEFAPCPGDSGSESGLEVGEGEMCGGIRGIVCALGYTCELDGDYPDASGVCVVDSGAYVEKQIQK